eukprot:7333559-Lingulodinium_polyedra.AAC.1
MPPSSLTVSSAGRSVPTLIEPTPLGLRPPVRPPPGAGPRLLHSRRPSCGAAPLWRWPPTAAAEP